jgi:hypothetical protein
MVAISRRPTHFVPEVASFLVVTGMFLVVYSVGQKQ